MTERIVEVEWEDTVCRHGWTANLVEISNRFIMSVGYAVQDDDEGIILLAGKDGSETSADQYDCSKFIPRSAIRNVTELSRKRSRG